MLTNEEILNGLKLFQQILSLQYSDTILANQKFLIKSVCGE